MSRQQGVQEIIFKGFGLDVQTAMAKWLDEQIEGVNVIRSAASFSGINTVKMTVFYTDSRQQS